MHYLRLMLLLSCLVATTAWAAEPFTVSDIRAEGLQRISAGTVFNYLPIKVGETVDDSRTAEAIKALYATGFFRNVELERDGSVLVVVVDERPAIAEIQFSGNKDLDTEQLTSGLRDIGLAEGQTFNDSLLDRIQQELTQLYFSRGKYAVKVTTTVTPLERNRVAVSIDINEGKSARIQQINLVGNTRYDDDELLDLFQLTTPGMFTWYTNSDQYSKQKLGADLERLRSFYLDRGHIRFNVDSTQVSITPDRQWVYVTINLTEGEPFTVSEVKLAGELVLPEAELTPLVSLRPGNTFSRRSATESSELLSRRLGDEGFAFANVNIVPEIDDEKKAVAVTLFVDPGRRVYVRQINTKGNYSTRDEVLRRELRQMESAWFSTAKINRSRTRLEQLGFFDEVNVETPAVPGTADQVDINFSVKERPAGNLTAGVGFSQSQGILLSASVTQENFFGSGKRVSIAFNNSKANTIYSFSYNNPYYTVDGISRGFSLFFRETDAEELNVSDYSTDAFGGNLSYGIPISETNRIRVQGEYRHTKLNFGSFPSQEIVDFVDANGDEWDTFALAVYWSHDTRNRGIFPTSGGRQRISASSTLPGGDLEFYKVSYDHTRYWPLITRALTFSLDGDVGYGEAFGDTTELPPYERYFAGGLNCVRGFEENSLGIKDDNGDALGGNFRMCGRAELIFPPPFGEVNQVRLAGFFDIGNVYDLDEEDIEFDMLRYSVGMGLTWLSPIGPLTFSYAFPFNEQDDDDKQSFQFQLGASF